VSLASAATAPVILTLNRVKGKNLGGVEILRAPSFHSVSLRMTRSPANPPLDCFVAKAPRNNIFIFVLLLTLISVRQPQTPDRWVVFNPFTLSLSKGCSWFDKLTTNGFAGLS